MDKADPAGARVVVRAGVAAQVRAGIEPVAARVWDPGDNVSVPIAARQ